MHYGPCPTVRDCLAVYPALFQIEFSKIISPLQVPESLELKMPERTAFNKEISKKCTKESPIFGVVSQVVSNNWRKTINLVCPNRIWLDLGTVSQSIGAIDSLRNVGNSIPLYDKLPSVRFYQWGLLHSTIEECQT